MELAVVQWVLVAGLMADPHQYEFGDIQIPQATVDEPVRAEFSLNHAVKYLEQGALAWNGDRKCVSCHTNGTYLTVMPALTSKVGTPNPAVREFAVANLKQLSGIDRAELKKSTRPAQVIYTAAGLAEWDAHVTGTISEETKQALALMFEIQLETGTWGTLDCWPPYESDAFHEATVAAMAVAAAPGWLDNLTDETLKAGMARLKKYLQTETPPQDYGRVLLLWASARMPDLLTAEKKQELIDLVWKKQQADGGWSIRTFGTPEQWGRGNRAAKLKAEPEFAAPPSDGHQTGLAIIVLREAGVPANDPRIQKGVAWLLKNQRESGRWWTRSLNTDSWHFITYSGTAFPLRALALCDALPALAAK